MAKDYNEKTVIRVPPCKVPDPCLEYENYDPCESSEDITEKDLAVLLKEEQAKLQREKEQAKLQREKEQAKLQREKDQAEAELRRQSAEGTTQSSGEGKAVGGEKPCHSIKKRLCRKLIKNPFFTNRLRFSNDLPPPPPFPPPQFFPRVDDSDSKVKVCPKRRKKCRKEKKENIAKDDAVDDGDEEGQKEGQTEDDMECLCLYEDECLEAEMEHLKKGKRKCKKPERFPCRKKVSEVSISLQPRHIPALQRDLPPTSPKDIPEVERQIMMACGNDCDIDCNKKKCKKKSEKVK